MERDAPNLPQVLNPMTRIVSGHERKAAIVEFYAKIFLSVVILHGQINNMNDQRWVVICMERCRRGDEDESSRKISFVDAERGGECGICMDDKNHWQDRRRRTNESNQSNDESSRKTSSDRD